MLWPIFLLPFVVYVMVVRWNNRKFHKIHKQLTIGFPQVPILGHALYVMGNSQDRMKQIERLGRDLVENRDGIGSLWLGNRFFVVVANPEALEVVMKTCLEKDDILNITRTLLGYGSIFAPVQHWRPRRKMVVPTFGQRTLNGFVKTFSIQSAIMIEQLKAMAGNGNFSIYDYLAKLSMDTICENALGTKICSQTGASSHPVLQAFNKFCLLTAKRIVRPWLCPDAIYKWTSDYPHYDSNAKILKDFVAKIVQSKRNDMAVRNSESVYEQTPKSKSLLELMIEAGMTDLEVQEEALVILLAGTDTTALTTSFLCLLLAKYPDIQEKVYHEIKEVVGDSVRHIEPNDLPKLVYLEAVIKETLRMYQTGPVIVRKVDKHVNLRSQYSMMSMKTLMAHLIPTYRILPSSLPQDASTDQLPTTFEIMLKHAHNFEIQLQL